MTAGVDELPARWAGRGRFSVLQVGFGAGRDFLATWAAWRADPRRCGRLVFIGIDARPQRAVSDSPHPELATQLDAAWPPPTPGLHALDFEGGRLRLLLAVGPARRWLQRELLADDIDAFLLDPADAELQDAHLQQALQRRARPAATARHVIPRPPGREPLAPGAKTALVIGAGLAGAACAWALDRVGVAATVVDARPGPAQASSGNPGGLYHGTLNPDDGIHARFNRAAALATERALRELPPLPWLQQGLLRLERQRNPGQMQALIDALGLPPGYVQALDLDAARAASGLDRLPDPAWFYPGGGALPPAAYVAAMLDAARAPLLRAAVAALRRDGDRWQALDAAGAVIAEAPLVVLAGGHEGHVLLQDLAPEIPLVRKRGQLTHLAASARRPRMPVAGLGYAIADPAGGLWCGATSDDGDAEPALRRADQQANLAQWTQLAGLNAPPEAPLAGRVAWRLATPDRLPLVGGLPAPGDGGRRDQARLIPRLPGLGVCTAFGSRGITWAALCGQLLAAQAVGEALPLEASLVDAIDPARFAVRRARAGG